MNEKKNKPDAAALRDAKRGHKARIGYARIVLVCLLGTLLAVPAFAEGGASGPLDTINNLSVMQENIQDAESTIRDTDVADEMMAYTKNNILIQSAQAMLAQANQVPQGVLQLLQYSGAVVRK